MWDKWLLHWKDNRFPGGSCVSPYHKHYGCCFIDKLTENSEIQNTEISNIHSFRKLTKNVSKNLGIESASIGDRVVFIRITSHVTPFHQQPNSAKANTRSDRQKDGSFILVNAQYVITRKTEDELCTGPIGSEEYPHEVLYRGLWRGVAS